MDQEAESNAVADDGVESSLPVDVVTILGKFITGQLPILHG